MRRRWVRGKLALPVGVLILGACVQYISPPTEASVAQRFAEAERLYADARDLYFKVHVTEANGTGRSAQGVPLTDLQGSYAALRERALERLEALDPDRFGGEDRRAYDVMHAALVGDTARTDDGTSASCGGADKGAPTFGALAERIYACYGREQSRVVTPRDTVDRLTVISRLETDTSSARRRALFLSLRPVWESVNGTNAPTSPWRRLVALSAEHWRSNGSPVEAAAASLGMAGTRIEPMLIELLDAWRAQQPSALVEPWDWYFANGGASRRLAAAAPLRNLERITEEYYSVIGASPRTLGVHFDLVPRAGKTPVAFTEFGGIPRRVRSGVRGADPWVFATYREGGFNNLVELLHETGHAIHLAAIETRPAFADWPDSDPFTEALADLTALEAYEGAWQVRYLGDSARTAESLREKYAGVMMDVAWALFEVRMHRDPARDPNITWTEITEQYLRIAPHPEWSWWAMRGQLIESPGYMMNYALGAMIAADLRVRVREQREGFTPGSPKLYPWLADHLYRFGRSRSSREVIQDVLGRPVGPEGLVRDLQRIGRGT